MYRSLFTSLSVAMLSLAMVGCSTNNDVVSNGPFVKHKHRKGFHLQLKKRTNEQTPAEELASMEVADPAALPALEAVSKPAELKTRSLRSVVASVMGDLEMRQSAASSALYFERSNVADAVPTEVKQETGKKFTRASKTQRRGRWALFFAILQGVTWLINLGSLFFVYTPTLWWINILCFVAFFTVALILGWKIRKRNDAAKWAVILAFGYLAMNVAIAIISNVLGAIFLL